MTEQRRDMGHQTLSKTTDSSSSSEIQPAKKQGSFATRHFLVSGIIVNTLGVYMYNHSIPMYLHVPVHNTVSQFSVSLLCTHTLPSLMASCCYKLLENPAITRDRTVREKVFHLMGMLVKKYNQALSMQHFSMLQ